MEEQSAQRLSDNYYVRVRSIPRAHEESVVQAVVTVIVVIFVFIVLSNVCLVCAHTCCHRLCCCCSHTHDPNGVLLALLNSLAGSGVDG
jgi:F0F1-type ATP synthase membrane subunit a